MNTKIIVTKRFGGFADTVKKKDSYKKFFPQFGKFLKLAILGHSTSLTEITQLVRFSNSKSVDELNRLRNTLTAWGDSSKVTE